MKQNFYINYKRVRNKAWEILVYYKISTLPVKLSKLCRAMGIEFYNYNNGVELIKYHKLESYLMGNDGFSTIINGKYVIFYSSEIKLKTRLRFTIAHELGHIVLGHVKARGMACGNGITSWNSIEQEPINQEEAEANIFASRLLAPACTLWGLNIHTADEIQKLCGLSFTTSQIRAERMAVLYEREKEWLQKNGRSQFLLDEREKQVYAQFQGFITGTKKDR